MASEERPETLQLWADIEKVCADADSVTTRVREHYDATDEIAYRCGEVAAAVQRLLWAMERTRSGRGRRQARA